MNRLSELHREGLRLADKIKDLISENDVIGRTEILKGLGEASERAQAEVPRPREGRPGTDFDGPSDSGPSPADNKHIRKMGTGRTSSQPPREKEPGREEKEEQEHSHTGRTKIVFAKDEEVAFKPKIPGQTEEHDWIQGVVKKIIGEGKSRRYDVQDPYPDDTTKPGGIHRSSASSMIPIPPVGAPLPEYEIGKRVLALYPDTSSFYRGEVKANLQGGAKVQLLFDDETAGTLKIVDRRFVLDHKDKA